MTTAHVIRREAPLVADERTMLQAWLDYHRATLLMKCARLTKEQLMRRAVEPSSLSLLGLVRHMTDVERGWFRRTLAGETGQEAAPLHWSEARPDSDFDDVDDADSVQVLHAYTQEVERCRMVAANVPLDHRASSYSVRWIYVHMIEEYARHNGHADLLRERIDGVVGD